MQLSDKMDSCFSGNTFSSHKLMFAAIVSGIGDVKRLPNASQCFVRSGRGQQTE